MASEMIKINHFDWMAQVYLPKIEWKHQCLTVDLDCVLRVGRVFLGCHGFGFALLGFGFGVCWPYTEEQKWAWQLQHYWPAAGSSTRRTPP